jgi:hypothetical protein
MTPPPSPAFAPAQISDTAHVKTSQITFKQLPEQLRQAVQAISQMLWESGQEFDAPIRTTLGDAETDLHIGMPVVPGSEDDIRQLAHTLVGYVHDAAPTGLREASTPVFLRFVSRDVTDQIADILPVDGVSQAIVVPVAGRDSLHATLRDVSIGDALEQFLRNFNDHFVLIADFSAAPEAFDAREEFRNLQKPLDDNQVKSYLAALGNIKAINEAMAAANNSFEATSALTSLINSIGRMAQKLNSYQVSQTKDGKDADITSLSSVRQSTTIRQDALQVEAQLRVQISNPSLSESARAGLRVALQQMQQQRFEAVGAKPQPTLTQRAAQNDNAVKPGIKTATDNKAKAQAGAAIPVKETPKSGATTVDAKAPISVSKSGKELIKTNAPAAAVTAAENKVGSQVSAKATATKDATKTGVTEAKVTSTGSALGNAAVVGATIAAPANVNTGLANKPVGSALGKEPAKTAIEGKATAATGAATGLATAKETTKTGVSADSKVTVPATAIGAKETTKFTATIDTKTIPASAAAIVSKELLKAGIAAANSVPVITSIVTTSAGTIVGAPLTTPTVTAAAANPVSALKAATAATFQTVSTDNVALKASQASGTINGIVSISVNNGLIPENRIQAFVSPINGGMPIVHGANQILTHSILTGCPASISTHTLNISQSSWSGTSQNSQTILLPLDVNVLPTNTVAAISTALAFPTAAHDIGAAFLIVASTIVYVQPPQATSAFVAGMPQNNLNDINKNSVTIYFNQTTQVANDIPTADHFAALPATVAPATKFVMQLPKNMVTTYQPNIVQPAVVQSAVLQAANAITFSPLPGTLPLTQIIALNANGTAANTNTQNRWRFFQNTHRPDEQVYRVSSSDGSRVQYLKINNISDDKNRDGGLRSVTIVNASDLYNLTSTNPTSSGGIKGFVSEIIKKFKAAAKGLCANCNGGNCATCTRGQISAAKLDAIVAKFG